jgi:tetratricopeptide (TPR) repeat protein
MFHWLLLSLALVLTAYPLPSFAQTLPSRSPVRRNADDYIRRADHYIRVGDYTRAISELTQALEVQPDCAPALRSRAESYLEVARASDRIESLTRELLDAPESSANARLVAQRAFAFYNTGDYDQAIRDYTTVLRVRPGWLAILVGRALAYAAAGRLTEAEEDYLNLQRLFLPGFAPRS